MFERYTEKARRVIFFSRFEASQYGSPFIETEHLLLGLLREDRLLAKWLLPRPGSVESIRREVESGITVRERISTSVEVPLSQECKRILNFAAQESESLSHNYIGTEHLLLGLLREEKCLAARILLARGVGIQTIRSKLVQSAPKNETTRDRMLSPEIEALRAQMTAIIVRDAQGHFDNPSESEAIQITVRIACEFFVFLQRSNGVPESDKAEHMAGTIRSGVDWFFAMAQTGRILTGLELKTGFGPKLPTTYSELKESYESVFHQVLESSHSIKAVGLLLSLVQMMLLFMTVYFESFQSFSG